MNYKKIISLSIILSLGWISNLSLSNAMYQEDSGYNDVIERSDFNFTADLESNGYVELKWDKIETTGDFKYYKVVRSSTNSNPSYPEDGYIEYSSDINFTSFTDNHPNSGSNYYRICKIMEDNNRYCSQTEKIYIEEDDNEDENDDYYEEKQEDDDDYKEESSGNKVKTSNIGLSKEVKTKLENMIKTFLNKLEEKDISVEDKIEIVTKVMVALEELEEKKPALSPAIRYLMKILNSRADEYKNGDGISDIESILNDNL